MDFPLVKKLLQKQISKEVDRLAELEKSINKLGSRNGSSPAPFSEALHK